MTTQVTYTSAAFEGSGTPAIETSANWLASLMTGGLAVGLCVLAIAIIGLLMLGGRLPVREGVRVIFGCFVLLGAPIIANAFVMTGEYLVPKQITTEANRPLPAPARELPPSAFDPYAGASLRQD